MRPFLGYSTERERLIVRDRATGTLVTITPDAAQLPNLVLSEATSVIVYSRVEKSAGLVNLPCVSPTLEAGANMVSFGCPPEGYTAFQWLNSLGTETAASIQRFDSRSGRFESAAFGPAGSPAGTDFSIVAGEGYVIFAR